MRLALLTSLLLLSACAERKAAPPPPEPVTPTPTQVASVAMLEDAGAELVDAAPPPPSWVDLVRREKWVDAAQAIDALPTDEQSKPEMKYARARCAISAGDGAKAIELLSGLESAAPAIERDVARARAEAQFLAGPFTEAAAFYAASDKPRDLARAADAFVKAKDMTSARRLADKAVLTAQRSKSKRDEAAARRARARVLGSVLPALAEPDLRWLATKAPATPEGLAAADDLEKQKKALNEQEKKEAVEGLLDAGSPAAKTAIGKLTLPPGTTGLRARAQALYRARAYAEAAKAFDQSAAARGPSAAEDLFYAGRSLARLHDHAGAKTRLSEVATKFRASPFAEKASYVIARLDLQDGKFAEAAAEYGEYLKLYRAKDKRGEAQYEHALALLSSGDPKTAREELGRLESRVRADEAVRLRELEGVAALRMGKKDEAITIWQDIVESAPLTWAAMMARARLAQNAVDPLPPWMKPVASAPAAKAEPALPPAAALLISVGLDREAERYVLDNERAIEALFSGRETEAVCNAYGSVGEARRRYRVGTQRVGLSLLMRPPSDAERWAWECVYPRPYAPIAADLESELGMPKGMLHAIMRQESAFDPAVISPAAAVGLMQLLPSTAKQIASETATPFDAEALTQPSVNLRLGALYLGKLFKTFQGSVVLSAAAYNAGPKAVSHWLEAKDDAEADLWVARIPYEETRGYVAHVAGNLARYQWLAGGGDAVVAQTLALPIGARAAEDAY